MKLGDVITLLKAGYTRAEIKEMESQVEDPVEPEEPAEPEPKEPEEPAEPKEPEEPEVDYKSLYEESQKKLEAAQALNLRKEIPTDDDNALNTLTEAIRGFM